MPIIYHVTTVADWDQAQLKGSYEPASLAMEGFIHCSQEEQIPATLHRYFEGKKQLVKLQIDTDKLKSQFIYEWSPSTADTFPHIYGPLNLDAVIGTERLS
jgi:uncharacterized protein (DUF952 family)